MSHQLKVAGIVPVSVGEIDPRREWGEEVVQDRQARVYRRLVGDDGCLKGAILAGDISGFVDLEEQIAREG